MSNSLSGPGKGPGRDPFAQLASSKELRRVLVDRLPRVAADVLGNAADLLLKHDRTGLVHGVSPSNRLEFLHNGFVYCVESRTIFPMGASGAPGIFEFTLIERPAGGISGVDSKGVFVALAAEPTFVLRSVKHGLGAEFSEQLISWRDSAGPEMVVGIRTADRAGGRGRLAPALDPRHEPRAFDALLELERIDGVLAELKSAAPFPHAKPGSAMSGPMRLSVRERD